MAAQKIHSTTQKFTEIVDFIDKVVILEGNNAFMVIELTASNFALLSKREQDLRIFSYAGLLNSITFPIQILIRNIRIDISQYLNELDEVIANTKNPQLAGYVQYYRTFVQEMVTVNVVLTKAFYIVIPFSYLEMGVVSATQQTGQKKSQMASFAAEAQKILETKAESLMGQLQKFASSAKILEREELIKLFYNIYNEGVGVDVSQAQEGADATMVKGAQIT
jgi:hypothetical protein